MVNHPGASATQQPAAALRWFLVAGVMVIGLGVPHFHWLYMDWDSSATRWTARLATLGLLALWFLGRPAAVAIADRRHRDDPSSGPSRDGISVIVPCHNASANAGPLVESILRQDYRPLEIILVENNSTDGTFETLLDLEQAHPEVRAFWIPPQPGEYAASIALNAAVSRARYPVILRLDDDTVLGEGAIHAAMVAIAGGPHTGVACNLRVKNPHESMWTRLQSLEYLLAMEADRRSQALLHTVLICSGGMQVFKRDVIVEHEGYVALPRVVSEDFDMTLKAHRAGYVTVAPESIGYTQVPRTLVQLVKQRYRWAICGTVSLWLHRRGICNADYWYGGLVGFVGLPMRAIMFLRDLLPLAFILDAVFLLHGDFAWFVVLALARMALLGAQIAVLSPALRCRQGIEYVTLIPLFSLLYGPVLIATRFVGSIAAVKHIFDQRDKLRQLQLQPLQPQTSVIDAPVAVIA